MKHVISEKKFFLLLIVFQIILTGIPPKNIKGPFKPFISVLSPETMKQYEKIPEKKQNKFLQKKDFKPFVSVLSPESMKQFLLEKEDDKDKEDKVGFAVKCMYIDEYSMYDISKLGINKFKEGTTAYNETISNTTIFYNFCYDLKGKDVDDACKNITNMQMFALSEDEGGNNKVCKPLASSIKKGNNWIKSKEADNTTILKIELNSKNIDHKAYYMLKCDKNLKKKKKNLFLKKVIIMKMRLFYISKQEKPVKKLIFILFGNL